jgi:protein-tyrosine-phosphatase
VESFGLLELGSAPALPEAVDLAARFELDLSGHRARHLPYGSVAKLDLVVGFEQIHVSTCVVDGGASIDRTFTLPELVELLRELDANAHGRSAVENARIRIEKAHALRSTARRRRTVLEIADPLGRSLSAQRRAAEEIHALVAELVSKLFG